MLYLNLVHIEKIRKFYGTVLQKKRRDKDGKTDKETDKQRPIWIQESFRTPSEPSDQKDRPEFKGPLENFQNGPTKKVCWYYLKQPTNPYFNTGETIISFFGK